MLDLEGSESLQDYLHCRVCPECSKTFYTNHGKKVYCSKTCQVKASRRNEWEKKKKNPRDRVKQLYVGALNRSKTKNLPFDIDCQYLYELWLLQDGRCCVSGVEFDLERPDEFGHCRWNAPSLDRIKPELGYTKGNLRLVCYQVNAAMQHYGLDHFIEVCKLVADHQRLG